MSADALAAIFGSDSLQWVLESDEPYTHWIALTQLVGKPADAPEVRAAHEATLRDPAIRELVDGLPPWGEGAGASGHHSPAYLPNRLNLLADLGVTAADDPGLAQRLESLASRQDEHGRFQSFGRMPGRPKPEWGSMLCDTNVITDVLIRHGLADDPRVHAALKRIVADIASTPQGKAWQCVPEHRTLWRGPGRKADVCPQVTLEGLRALSHLPPGERPRWLLGAARTPLEVWRRRTEERPYAFGHGYQFKSVKWPNFWYDVLWVLETVGRYPELWRGARAREQDRRAIAELAACLVAYNVDEAGRVTPRRTYRGFEHFSFGQKRLPSPFATASVLRALLRFSDLADDIRDVDVETLPSSKGGSGTAMPPKGAPPCPVPTMRRTFTADRVMPRIFARHHLSTPWEPASIESVVADIVGLHATSPTTPYLSLHARLAGFERPQLDSALYERRSLVRIRCMRGTVFVIRRDLLPAAFASSRRQTGRYAREFARFRGITPQVYARLAPRVLDLVSDAPLTAAGIRKRLDPPPGVDVATLVNLMTTECLLLRDRPAGGWKDRRWAYVSFEAALPDVRLDAMDEDAADVILARAYVRSFGPVTLKDLMWWTGLATSRARRAIDALGDELVEIALSDSEHPHFMHAADVDELGAASMPSSPYVEFLPNLDPLVMGYARRERFVADAYRPLIFDRSGNATSVVLVDGSVAGVWDTTELGAPRTLVHLLEHADADVWAAVETAASAVGEFLCDAPVEVERVPSMIPLPDRPAGSVVKPLRP